MSEPPFPEDHGRLSWPHTYVRPDGSRVSALIPECLLSYDLVSRCHICDGYSETLWLTDKP